MNLTNSYRNKYFTKRTLNKFDVLHELYHHIVYANDWVMSERVEERKANTYARRVLKASFSA